jgi:hypothetical protein
MMVNDDGDVSDDNGSDGDGHDGDLMAVVMLVLVVNMMVA